MDVVITMGIQRPVSKYYNILSIKENVIVQLIHYSKKLHMLYKYKKIEIYCIEMTLMLTNKT